MNRRTFLKAVPAGALAGAALLYGHPAPIKAKPARAAATERIMVPAEDAPFYRWLLEAPSGSIGLLCDIGEEADRRWDKEEPADLERAVEELLPFAWETWQRRKATDPELAAFLGGGGFRAWQARKPAGGWWSED